MSINGVTFNPFQMAIAIMNVGASYYYLTHGNPKLAILVACYAVASVVLAVM